MTRDRRGEIERDVRYSHLAGPVRVLLPTAVVFFTYPLLLRTAGIGVVGVWSVLSSILAYAGLLDVGFTALLTREMASGVNTDRDARRVARWRSAAARVYVIGGIVLVSVEVAVSGVIIAWRAAPITSAYPNVSLLSAVIALTIAAVLMLLGKLELAVFRAHHQSYAEQWATAMSLTATYVIGWIGITLGRPIEGLAVGAIVAYGATFVVARAASRRRFADFFERIRPYSSTTTRADVIELVAHGRHLFSLNVAFVLREPIFRVALGSGLGVAAVGVYDIANRVPMLIRELGAAGTSSVLPSIARLTRDDDRRSAIAILESALRYALLFGGIGLATFAVNRELLFRLWLGANMPAGLESASLLMTVWWVITLLNAPFFWMMQARGLERQLAKAVALHILGLLCAVPFLRWSHASLLMWLTVWTVAGLATQAYLYVVAERVTALVRPVLLTRSVSMFIGVSVIAAATGVAMSPGLGSDHVTFRAAAIFVVAWMAAYAVLISPIVFKWIGLLRHARHEASVPQFASEPA